MPNSPLTNTRIPDSTYTADIADIVHKAIYDLEGNTCPRFTTTTARDAAYSAWVAAGYTLADGRECYTDDAGFWDHTGGAWVLRTSPPKLRLTATSDATATSTLHAFQVGPDTDFNFAADTLGIIARRNGALVPISAHNCQIASVAAPTSGDMATNKSYVDGTTANLAINAGWAVLPNYHTPAYTLSSQGWYTLSGGLLRTGSSFALGAGTPFAIATLPSAPVSTISPICYVGLGTGSPAQTYPARLYCAAGSTTLNVVGMDSGSGTIAQNLGYVNFDGVTFRI